MTPFHVIRRGISASLWLPRGRGDSSTYDVKWRHRNLSETSSFAADMALVRAFLRQAEEILDVAVAGSSEARDLAILIDRQGGMRRLDPNGWSVPAPCAEVGGGAVYTVGRRPHTVRVEGWGGGERCLLQRDLGARVPITGLRTECPVRVDRWLHA